MSGGPVYRRATPADAQMLCALMSDPAVFGGLLQLPYPSADAWRKRLEEQVLQPAALHLLALDAHGATPAVIGSAGIHPIGPSQRQKHVGGMGICVAPAWQRRGVGSELVRRLLDWADNWAGYLRVELQVYTDNVAALALYRKFGFDREGTLRAHALRDGRFVDSHFMARLHPRQPQVDVTH
ncbi:MAG: GNAT family N-acetyltransferase [Burkholderiales bacterium]|nr:GNAT family N-acetyltransferase [Burkholderiales bacterium]MCA3229299.1 GNAT family N-acetyltransferase [Burkholderiales bacterium]